MHSIYATRLGFCTGNINIYIQNLDGSHIDTIETIIVNCLIKNKLKKV